MSQRPNYLRSSPRFDRTHWAEEWHRQRPELQIADLFCGRGGVGHALKKFFPHHVYAGFDIVDYSAKYPGQFIQCDLINNRPINRDRPTADIAWVSFPCTAYSSLSATHYGSAEAALEANPRITDEFRAWLRENFAHYIIENVPRATYHGDLDANVRINGPAFGQDYIYERHFETTFSCPDAWAPRRPDKDYITIDTRSTDDQSSAALADAKGLPEDWSDKQAIRSATPWQYVYWLLAHCPSIQCPCPKQKRQPTLGETIGTPGRHQLYPSYPDVENSSNRSE